MTNKFQHQLIYSIIAEGWGREMIWTILNVNLKYTKLEIIPLRYVRQVTKACTLVVITVKVLEPKLRP